MLLIGLCVGLGLYAEPLLDVVVATVEQMNDPTIYIQAVFGGA
jgi:formate hydrogenlyase subunit 3/multisubunit Na+/H+ antiporter MnhD subunit